MDSPKRDQYYRDLPLIILSPFLPPSLTSLLLPQNDKVETFTVRRSDTAASLLSTLSEKSGIDLQHLKVNYADIPFPSEGPEKTLEANRVGPNTHLYCVRAEGREGGNDAFTPNHTCRLACTNIDTFSVSSPPFPSTLHPFLPSLPPFFPQYGRAEEEKVVNGRTRYVRDAKEQGEERRKLFGSTGKAQ
jgi:hypothetical protein